MILDELTLHNFGTYRGRQTILLRPPSKTSPIVLIGGMNGRGKTTLLDALQLALYGKRAKCSNRGVLAYDEYLRRSIHNRTALGDGAAVELRFSHNEEGRVHTYEIRRSWLVSGSNARERVQVSKDGHVDQMLSDHWDEQVEYFLPLGLSTLFFFDGEKIEDLATVEKGQDILRSAISALLGIDLVDRLEGDLLVLERRKAAEMMRTEDRDEFITLEKSLEVLEARREDLTQRRAGQQNTIDRLERSVAACEQRFKAEGGEFYINRADLDRERALLERQVDSLNAEMRAEAAGALPLNLVRELLEDVARQYELERSTGLIEATAALVSQRDKDILERFRARSSASAAKTLEALFTDDNESRFTISTERYLKLSLDEGALLAQLRSSELTDSLNRTSVLLTRTAEIEKRLGDVMRALASVPDESQLKRLTDDLAQMREQLTKEQDQLRYVETELELVSREITLKSQKRTTLARAATNASLEQADNQRIIRHSERVRKTLDSLRRSTVERHVAKLEHLVLDSFKQLIRKKSLLAAIRIDPMTLTLRLVGDRGQELLTERLSAGERQILAISLLWGLGRASGRSLPTVIDTPLGRLDGTIRENIVRNYFPNASHQVILLSTDMEIDQEALSWIPSSIGRKYQLVFDDATSATTIADGYFTETDENVA